jgi:hypothetical protein
VTDESGAGFISQPMTLKVVSVLDPQKKQEKPFGPISPLTMQWPMWVAFSAIVFLLVLVGWLLIYLRRRIQRKTLEKNIRKYQSPLGSYHQYSKDIRLLKRGVLFSPTAKWTENQIGSYLQKLDEIFRMYILREFVVPANKWSVSAILKNMRHKDRAHFANYSQALIKAFKELERAQGQVESLRAMDCEQLTTICTQAVDGMWKSKMARSR